jgi:hypothetical protein
MKDEDMKPNNCYHVIITADRLNAIIHGQKQIKYEPSAVTDLRKWHVEG